MFFPAFRERAVEGVEILPTFNPRIVEFESFNSIKYSKVT